METPRIPRGGRVGWDKERDFRMCTRRTERCGGIVQDAEWRINMENKCLDPTLKRAPEQRLAPSARVPFSISPRYRFSEIYI